MSFRRPPWSQSLGASTTAKGEGRKENHRIETDGGFQLLQYRTVITGLQRSRTPSGVCFVVQLRVGVNQQTLRDQVPVVDDVVGLKLKLMANLAEADERD